MAMLRAESTTTSMPPMSPFLSESAHVLSLQYPDMVPMEPSPEGRTSAVTSMKSTPNLLDVPVPVLEEEASNSDETVSWKPSKAGQPDSSRAVKLCIKTFKNIESRLKNKTPTEHSPGRQLSEEISPATETVLNLNTRFFGKTPTWLKDERGKINISRRLFDRSSWHRKKSGASVSTISSSVREVTRGGTTPVTPESAKTRRLLSPVTASQYPGGEATRIPTPPLDEDTADGRARGFFTSATPPDLDGSLPPTSPVRGPRPPRLPRSDIHRRSLTGPAREWWEQASSKKDASPKPLHKGFDFDVPEHLPNSPLCPANKKHRGGGTGLCVYHGRSKGGSTLRKEALMMESQVSVSTQDDIYNW